MQTVLLKILRTDSWMLIGINIRLRPYLSAMENIMKN